MYMLCRIKLLMDLLGVQCNKMPPCNPDKKIMIVSRTSDRLNMLPKHHFTILCISAILLICNGCVKSKRTIESTRQIHSLQEKEYFECIKRDVPSQMTLEDIVEIALNQNLDLFVKELEYKIQREAATGAKLDMLPELLFSGEANKRNNNPGSASASLTPGVSPAPPSVSSDKKTTRWNITLTWNLLDFGISYYKARQEANAVLIQLFEFERLKQNLILDLTVHYWNAIASLEAIIRTEDFIDILNTHEVALVKAADSHFISKTRVLTTQEKILDYEFKMKEYQREYHFAMSELTRLMGLPPSVEFELLYDRMRPLTIELPHVKALEEIALQERPELYNYDMEEKISIDEVRIAFLELFPGSSMFAGYNYDENRFLVNNYWNLIGLKTAWDLFSIPSRMSREKIAKQQISLARRNRLALSLATISQVNLAYLLYLDDMDRHIMSLKIENIKWRQLKDAETKKNVGRFDLADVLEYESNVLDAEIKAWKTYGDVQYSLEQLNNAIGLPLYFRNLQSSNDKETTIEPDQLVLEDVKKTRHPEAEKL